MRCESRAVRYIQAEGRLPAKTSHPTCEDRIEKRQGARMSLPRGRSVQRGRLAEHRKIETNCCAGLFERVTQWLACECNRRKPGPMQKTDARGNRGAESGRNFRSHYQGFS